MPNRSLLCSPFIVLALGLLVAGPLPAAAQSRTGERLPADALSDGVVETWDDMLTRMRRQPPPNRIDVEAPFNRVGVWAVPSDGAADHAHSGTRYLTNRDGERRLSIGFPDQVTLRDAWLAGQGGLGAWAEAVRFIGYRDGREVGRTAWSDELIGKPRLVTINLRDVDRVVVEAQANATGGSWYALDDLTYVEADGATRTLDFEDLDFRAIVTDSDYAGLTWGQGAGQLGEGDAVHPPIEAERDHAEEDPADADAPEELPADVIAGADGAPTAPVVVDHFEGVRRGDAGQFSFPPDPCAAAGPDHVVAVTNLNFAVFNAVTGAQQSNVPLGGFQPGSGGDPRVIFDHHSRRWIVMSTDFGTRILLAVSTSSNPLGSWFKTAITISRDADAGRWPDYPTLGVDANGIYIASMMVGSPTTMTVLAVDKAPLLAPSPSLGTVTAFRNLAPVGSMQPCVTYGDSGGVFIAARWSNTSIRLWQIQGALDNAPTLSFHGSVSIPSHAAPPDVPALGSTVNLDTVGPRLMNAVWRDGQLWTAHTVALGTRSCVRWYAIDTATRTATHGTVLSFERSYFFPSLSVNAFGDVAMGFTAASADTYASAWFTGRRGSDAPGQMADPQPYRVGSGPINLIDGFGRNRWGDYSLTTIDPDDPFTFWTIQSYGRSTNTWSTEIARLAFDPIETPLNDSCPDALVVSAGATPFSTIGATTDGPVEAATCLDGALERDVWFAYTAECSGTLTADVCDANYDAQMAIYVGLACPTEPGTTIMTCLTDGCGAGDDRPSATFPVTAGETFLIRIGGDGDVAGAGTLALTCTPGVVCPADFDGDELVGFTDLLTILSAWGPCAECPADLDDDGSVGFSDLLQLLSSWGAC